jgi:hypothetical protein
MRRFLIAVVALVVGLWLVRMYLLAEQPMTEQRFRKLVESRLDEVDNEELAELIKHFGPRDPLSRRAAKIMIKRYGDRVRAGLRRASDAV